MNNPIDVIVIGAGQAGVSLSYYLKKLKINHIVFERGVIGDTWKNQRWENFKLNTPNRMNILPESDCIKLDPSNFCSANEFSTFLRQYAESHRLPIWERCNVKAIEIIQHSKVYIVSVEIMGQLQFYYSKNIIVAAGFQNIASLPSFANTVSDRIFQLHSSQYQNAGALPEGGILIIGSGQSGVQIAADILTNSSKKIYLSTSKVGRLPRQYKGRDIEEWLIDIGLYETRVEDIKSKSQLEEKQPVVSGVDMGSYTLSLQFISNKGAILIGSALDLQNNIVYLDDNVFENLKYADEYSNKIKAMVDDYIHKFRLCIDHPTFNERDLPDFYLNSISNVTSLNLIDEHINTIIWATGFNKDFSFLKMPMVDNQIEVKHQKGISEINGLFFLGMPWQRKMKSGIIYGVKEDAEFIVEQLSVRLAKL